MEILCHSLCVKLCNYNYTYCYGLLFNYDVSSEHTYQPSEMMLLVYENIYLFEFALYLKFLLLKNLPIKAFVRNQTWQTSLRLFSNE